jgi:translation initiation factor IF-1
MPGTDAFKTEGVVVEALPNNTYRVELANGHRLLGYVAGKAKALSAGLRPGARVKLELSPYDLSQGRILVDRQ